MQMTPPNMITADLPLSIAAPQLGVGHHFSQMLLTSDSATDRTPTPKEAVIRQSAEELVAMTLIKPLLEQARQDPFKSELFHGGFAEDAFGAQLDSVIAERMTHSIRLPVVDSVYSRIVKAANRIDTHG